jgi:type VI secretion system secreted protein VgrG
MVGPNILQKGVTAAMAVMRNKLRDVMTDNLGKFTDMLGFLSPQGMGEGNLVIGVGKNKAETVMVSSTEVVGGAKTVTVGGGYQLAVQGIRHDSVMLGAYEEVGQNKTIVVGKTFEIVCGKTKFKMSEEGIIEIEAEKHIVLRAKKIDLNP